MPALWRLYRSVHGPGLDGLGGTFADGRWHTRGARVVYFGASAAIAVLERLAHTDPDLLPNDLQLGRFEISHTATKADEIAPLPADWIRDQSVTRHIGGRWQLENSSCLLTVPSAILPEEANFIFNALHPAARLLRLVHQRPFAFDARLI
jgi:RES domain-containing protein